MKLSKKVIKAWALLTAKGKLKEWYDHGSGLRILKDKKSAEEYLAENSRWAIYPKKDSQIVPCEISYHPLARKR